MVLFRICLLMNSRYKRDPISNLRPLIAELVSGEGLRKIALFYVGDKNKVFIAFVKEKNYLIC